MADGEIITVKGASGRMHDFLAYPWGTQFQAVGGVYLVLKQQPTGDYTILYIGQTTDLSACFDNHQMEVCFTMNGKTHVGVKPEGSEQTRFAIEADLIQYHRTTCNE